MTIFNRYKEIVLNILLDEQLLIEHNNPTTKNSAI